MIDISIEEILKIVENKYKAIVIASQEARRLNISPPGKEGEEKEKEEKKDSLKPLEEALRRFVKGKIKFEEEEGKK